MTLAASTRLGRYEVLSKLGFGGMGEVYRARDSHLERDVAIKVLPDRFAQDPKAMARFQREAKAIAALSHPNILVIFDVGVEQGLSYAVMELLEGQTLASRIKKASLTWREALEIGTAVADGLAAAHAKGIIHRDIKPSNIFLTAAGGVKILDFGLARLETKSTPPPSDSGTANGLNTESGVLLGTIAYMSPEQVRAKPADARSDVFAFGCVLYEMLSGRRPFTGDTDADVIAAILHDPAPALTESGGERPATLDRVILRCLEKKPDQRFPSALELAKALKALGASAIVSTQGDAGNPQTAAYLDTPRPQAVQPTAPSVAVLPFVNMSSDKENEYFSDGLAEDLLDALTKIEGLHVASRTSSFAFKGKSEDVRRVGEQLNVRTVLEGSVRKSGNRLRIHAQLVNVADGYHLWSETYNRQLEDVFAIQDEITQNIVKSLRVILSEKTKHALEKAPTADVKAYDCYLRGRQYFHYHRRKSLEFAQQMFARAIEIDPNYARAYAGMADSYSLLYIYWNANKENLMKADAASRKALELDPELAESHVARGIAATIGRQYDEARDEFETALRLNPNLFEAHYFYGRACRAQRKLAEAALLFEKAARLCPEDYQTLLAAGNVHASLGHQREAESAYRHGLQLAQRHLELHPDDTRALCLGAIASCRIGDKERGLDWARRALAMDPDEAMTAYNVACAYALMGRTEEALDCLTQAIANGYAYKEWIQNDADLDSLRSHPRFLALLQKL